MTCLLAVAHAQFISQEKYLRGLDKEYIGDLMKNTFLHLDSYESVCQTFDTKHD